MMTRTEMRDEIRRLKTQNKKLLAFHMETMRNYTEARNETYSNAREIGELSRQIATLQTALQQNAATDQNSVHNAT